MLNRNGQAVNAACLESLKRSGYANLRVSVADNASTDGSPEWIEQHHPDVTVLRTGGNLGWSGGNNVGIRYALEQGADYVWILNNDVEVEPDCIGKLVARSEQDRAVAITGPTIHYFEPRDRVWFEGAEVVEETFWVGHCDAAHFQALPQGRRYVSGCALMVRREVFERIGLVDERFFIYYEDADFCRRAARAGFHMDIVGDAVMYHKVSAYSGGPSEIQSSFQAYHTLRSGLLFWRKHASAWRFHRGYCGGHLGKWVNNLPEEWAARDRRRERAEAIIDAVWYLVAHRNAPRERPAAPAWFRRLMLKRPWVVARLLAWRLPVSTG